MSWIAVTLKPDEKEALGVLAERERRDPRDQAAHIIRWALEELGYLQPQAQQPQVKILEGASYEYR